jgi:hypothetical protein
MKVGKIVFPRKTHPCGQGAGFTMLYATAGLKPLMAADGILPKNIGWSTFLKVLHGVSIS